MKFATLCKWVAVAALFVGNASAHAAVVAMLLDVRGTASVTASGRTSAAQVATSLQEDTTVEVAAGGQVVLVHYATREQTTLAGPATVNVTPKGVEPVSGTQGQSRKLGDGEAKVATNYRGRIVAGALTMRGAGAAVAILYPADGETLLDPTRPFRWESEDAKAQVQVKLFEGDKLLVERQIAGDTIAVSQLASQFARGVAYRLVVAVGSEKPADSTFKLALEEQIDFVKGLKPEDKTSVPAWVIYAMALEANGFVADAKEAWRVVADLRPSAATIARRMLR